MIEHQTPEQKYHTDAAPPTIPCSSTKKSIDIIVTRDKTSLDILWLKDKGLANPDNWPVLDELASAIIENQEAGLENLRAITAALM